MDFMIDLETKGTGVATSTERVGVATRSVDVMIDLETMGTGPSAAIVSLGAVVFDLETGELPGDGFYSVHSLQSAVKAGGVIDPSTVDWWMRQDSAARKEICQSNNDRDIHETLWDFRNWCNNLGPVNVWGNGATFDLVILSEAYARVEMERPWTYKGERCYRTINALFGQDIPFEREGTYHNALDDARSQALHLIKILKGKA